MTNVGILFSKSWLEIPNGVAKKISTPGRPASPDGLPMLGASSKAKLQISVGKGKDCDFG